MGSSEPETRKIINYKKMAENINIINNIPYDDDHHQPDVEEHHANRVYRFVNNNRYILNRPGNDGYYTRSHHFQTTDEWDAIFDHIVGHPHALHDTSGFIYDLSFGGRVADHESFPEIVYIPLPSNEPGFRRCILHVEEFDTATNTLTGCYIPVVVKYHVNHPISEAITRLFEVETRSQPFYQTKQQLLMLTSGGDGDDVQWIQTMCEQFRPPGNDFAAFEEMNFPAAAHILPDPALVIRANREVRIPDYDDDPIEAQAAYTWWRNIVYPRGAMVQERREMYATFAAEQVNMHRYSRLQWARDYPNLANPIELPGGIERENNPVDRNAARQNLANAFIEALYSAQTNDERARIAATDVRLRDPLPAPHPEPALPVNRVLELD
jgi:hypothetical protein